MPAEQRIRILTPEQAASDIATPSTAIGAVLSNTVGASTPTARYSMPAYGSAVAKHLAGTSTALRWLTWGDSMATGIHERLAPALRRAFGGTLSGVYFSGPIRSTTANATTGTVTESVVAYDVWPTGLVTTFAAGAERTYGAGGASVVCNKIKVYYVKEAGAGTFKLQVDGVDVVGFESVSAVGGGLGIATLAPTLGAHTVKLVGLTGSVRVIGVGFEDTTISGYVAINVSKGGLGLNEALGSATARANLAAFIADVAPTVISHEMKENAAWYDEGLRRELGIFTTSAPAADIVLVATPETGDPAPTGIPEQNAILRALAAEYGVLVFDADKAFGPYSDALTAGFYSVGDKVHYNTVGQDFLAGLYARDLNLFGRFGPAQSRLARQTFETGFSVIPEGGDAVAVFEQSSGFDLLLKLKRAFKILKADGVEDANSWEMRPDGENRIPNGTRVGNAGAYLRSTSTSSLSVMSARGGGGVVQLRQRSFSTQQQVVSASGVLAIDLTLGNTIIVTLTGNVTSWSILNPVGDGEVVEIHFIQDAVGGRTLSGKAAAIKLAGGALLLSTAANARDAVQLRFTSSLYVETSRSLALA